MKHTHGHSLSEDLRRMVALADRRRFIRTLLGAGLIPLVGCGKALSDSDASAQDSNATGNAGGTTVCSGIPEETAGPYPGDGSNGPNVLDVSGIVRSDLRTSFGSLSGTAAGVPLTVKLALVSAASSCTTPLGGRAVYLWHCDRDGNYSLYGAGQDQNYLRGVQETDSNGEVTFTTIFPACYSGRWPHIHFEVFPSLASISAASNKSQTSQIAMPADVCDTVFASSGYSTSVQNLARTSLKSDMVFNDGYSLQLPAFSGGVASGLTATLRVAVS